VSEERHFIELSGNGKSPSPLLIDFCHVQGWWADKQSGTIVLISGREIWIGEDWNDFTIKMSRYVSRDRCLGREGSERCD
jgi:hypothetical protein